MKFHEGVLGLLLATVTCVAGSSPAGGYYGGAGGYGGHPQQQQQHTQQYPGYYQQQQIHQQYHQPNYQPQQTNQVEDKQTTTTQEDVAAPAEETKDGEKSDMGALPEPWQEHIDPSSGRPYYYNPETSVTQWGRPEAPAQPAPSPEAQPSQHQQPDDTHVRANADQAMPSDQPPGANTDVCGGVVNETVMPKVEESPQSAAGSSPQSDGTFAAGNNGANASGVDGRNPDEAPKPEDQPPIRTQGVPQAVGNQMPQPFGEPQSMQYNGQSMPGQHPWGVQRPGPAHPMETSSPASEPQQQADKSAGPQGQEHGQAQGGTVDPLFQRHPIQRQPNQGMDQQPEIRSQPQVPPGAQTQPDQPNPNQQGDPTSQRRPPNQWQPPPSQQLPPNQGQQYQPQQVGGSPQAGGPPQYPGRPGPYGMPPQQPGPQQRGGPPGYPPQPGQGPYGQQPSYGQRPPQYPGQPQYPYNYGAPPQSGPGAGQLVQQRTEDLSNAVKEKWGQALGGLSVFGNRTKELAGNARDQITESANNAGKAIGETSTGLWGKLRSSVDTVKSSVFERNTPQNQQGPGYSLSNYGVPPPQRGGPPPGYGGYPGQPPMQQYPPRQMPPNYPPGQMPRPNTSAPYPHQGGPGQQNQPPMQSQWQGRSMQQGPPMYQQGRPGPMQGQPPRQGQPPQGQHPPQNQQYSSRQQPGPGGNPADHPGWNQ